MAGFFRTKPLGMIKYLKLIIHGIPYIVLGVPAIEESINFCNSHYTKNVIL